MSCGKGIYWYDNIPLLSWLLLRGACRACGGRISVQYPIVEALTGALFALVGASSTPLVLQVLALTIIALLILITLYDLRHTIIPDEWVYSFAALALLMALLTPATGSTHLAFTLLAGPVAALPLFALWYISGGRWMGLGDVKLTLGMGWLLGPLWGVAAVFFAFIIGAVVSLAILLPLPYFMALAQKTGIARFPSLGTRFTMKSEVPFGPFLVASCLFVWFSLLYHIPLPL